MTGITYGRLAGLVLLAVFSRTASAAMVEFRPSTVATPVGDLFAVDVYFVPDASTLVNEFDVTVDWDPALLDLTDVSFGPLLGLPPDADEEVIVDAGSVDVFELSSGDLSGQSGMDAFRLFTLTYRGLTVGTTELTFDSVVVEDADGNAIAASTGAGSVTVGDTVDVPLPGALWLALLLSGIGALKVASRGAHARAGARLTRRVGVRRRGGRAKVR
jgi:hypothetical protein